MKSLFLIVMMFLSVSCFAVTDSVKINDSVVFAISDTDKKLLANDLIEVNNEIERRLQYIIEHKLERCFVKMKKEWIPKLEALGYTEIPITRDDFVELVTSQESYKTKAEREV